MAIPRRAVRMGDTVNHLCHGEHGGLSSTSYSAHLTHEVAPIIGLFRLTEHVELRVNLAAASAAAFPAVITCTQTPI